MYNNYNIQAKFHDTVQS